MYNTTLGTDHGLWHYVMSYEMFLHAMNNVLLAEHYKRNLDVSATRENCQEGNCQNLACPL